ncbi:hypothetical protein QYE76_009903 [Lolium multiflorum]|uniref:Integrase catalytic domain-containing protein n=1 Tax=Lolium multiflorum TaxID=4521 RepID=A0AAD8TTZ8_LOLMU|nr:hypothetical protein QYE76_009903 [Lolium multiflorum]
MAKDIVGLMQTTGNLVGMIETTKVTSAALVGGQENKKTWTDTGISLSSSIVGTSGMSRLPTIDNCPECSRRRAQVRFRVRRLGPLPSQNRKAESCQGEDFVESEDEEEDRYHRPRWCPDGLSHSQKRRVQRLRNLEEAEAQYLYTLRKARPDLAVKIQQTLEAESRPQKKEWRPKQAKADAKASVGTNMVFILPSEFCAPRTEEVSVAQLDCGPRRVIFEKPRERRSQNAEANDLAQMASGYKDVADGADVQVQFMEPDDWRADIFNYLKDSARGPPKWIRYKTMKYVLIGDDMFYRTLEGLLLKCLGPAESNRLLHEVHEGACGTHQSAHKMKWLIRRSGFYWPTMLEDCFKYYKGCQACQNFGSIQMVPASAMNPIIKPWPFRGWGMDMIGKINPPSSKGHAWVLAITDYFTKWVEAVPMKSVASKDVVSFVKEHVIHRFGIPQTITTDGGSVFVSHEFRNFCEDMGIKLIRSSPYYAQANGQAEASNKSLIKLIKRKIDEYPRRWHEVLSEALWAYRMSCHGAIKTSPYHLVYGQEAVLPWEITAGSRRVAFQNDLTTEEYAALMSDSIEDVTELRLWSLEKIKENKAKVARAYNKKVRPKEFHVGDLVWEAVLPLGTKDAVYGKWSPNWHGPYRVDQVLKGNAYMLEQLDGVKFQWLSMSSISRSISQLPSAQLPTRSSSLLMKPPAGASSSSSSSSPHPTRVEALGRWVLLEGGVLLRLFLLVGGEVRLPREEVIVVAAQLPVDEERRSSSPSVRGSSSSDSMEESQSLASQYSGARASYMAIRLTSGSSSLEEEDWKERPEETEEEEESMAAEKGFLPMASAEQGNEEANCLDKFK